MCHEHSLGESIFWAIAGGAILLLIVALVLWAICGLWMSVLSGIDDYRYRKWLSRR